MSAQSVSKSRLVLLASEALGSHTAEHHLQKHRRRKKKEEPLLQEEDWASKHGSARAVDQSPPNPQSLPVESSF